MGVCMLPIVSRARLGVSGRWRRVGRLGNWDPELMIPGGPLWAVKEQAGRQRGRLWACSGRLKRDAGQAVADQVRHSDRPSPRPGSHDLLTGRTSHSRCLAQDRLIFCGRGTALPWS
jgi:hypothetical protein